MIGYIFVLFSENKYDDDDDDLFIYIIFIYYVYRRLVYN